MEGERLAERRRPDENADESQGGQEGSWDVLVTEGDAFGEL